MDEKIDVIAESFRPNTNRSVPGFGLWRVCPIGWFVAFLLRLCAGGFLAAAAVRERQRPRQEVRAGADPVGGGGVRMDAPVAFSRRLPAMSTMIQSSCVVVYPEVH